MEEKKTTVDISAFNKMTATSDVGKKIININNSYKSNVEKAKNDCSSNVAELKEKCKETPENKAELQVQIKEIKAKTKEQLIALKEDKKTNLSPLIEEKKEAIKSAKVEYNEKRKQLSGYCKEKSLEIKERCKTNSKELNSAHKQKLSEIKSSLSAATTDEDKAKFKFDLDNEKFSYKQKAYELKIRAYEEKQAIKDLKHDLYLDYFKVVQEYNGGCPTVDMKFERRAVDYGYKFNSKDFLLRNGLYIIILLFIIMSCIISPIIGSGNLLTMGNILQILEQSSTRIFFALGVGGLILLAGTDLSIGRHVGMAAVITCMFLHPGANIIKLFGNTVDFSGLPMGVNALFALLISVLLCSAFSVLAGFFTAKLNMHPFVTTLSTQLIIFGLTCFATGTTSSGTIDSGIKNALAGRIGDFPILIFYAIICIAVVWFIWNKTKFGKNMYAVGGNKEAAAVSGINVFKTTILVFLMAGILYGVGSFLEALRIGTAVATTGTGYELDAIAACVVGGISFSGGIGKVKGAVIGVILFTAITYILTYLGLDANIQFILKGIIIMAAVALDSIKYLKKK